MTSGIPRIGVVTFPGSLDDRDALRAVETMGGEPRPALARGRRPPRRRRRDPAGRVQLRRLPPHRRDRPVRDGDGRRPGVRRTRRPRARHLQRLPGALRERLASRRADPQPLAPVRLSPGARAGGDHADAGHVRPDARRGARDPREARRGAVRLRRGGPGAARGRRPGRVPLLRAGRHDRRRAQPQRQRERDRRRPQRRRQRRGADAASRARRRSRRRAHRRPAVVRVAADAGARAGSRGTWRSWSSRCTGPSA